MKYWRTLPAKRSALIIALLFLGVSLLFSGCDIPAFQKILCDDCPVSNLTNTQGTFNIQYLDCNEDVKSVRLTIGSFQVVRIDDCLRIIKTSPVPTSE
jgi:hypothetical protein